MPRVEYTRVLSVVIPIPMKRLFSRCTRALCTILTFYYLLYAAACPWRACGEPQREKEEREATGNQGQRGDAYDIVLTCDILRIISRL